MRQSKKLIFLAALLTGFQLNTRAEATITVDLESITGTAKIGTSVNATVTTPILTTLALTDVACVALGTSSTALVTKLGVSALGGFTSSAEFWANQTGQTITTFTDAEGGTITGVTGTFVLANMTRDIVVGCGSATSAASGEANSTETSTSDNLTYAIDIELVAAADWFTEVDDLLVYGEFHTATNAPETADSGTETFDADFVRPVAPSGVARRIGDIDLAVFGGAANITAADITSGGQAILNFTGPVDLTVAGIGAVISLNVTVPTSAGGAPAIIIAGSNTTVIKADLGLGSPITVFDLSGGSSVANLYNNGNFHLNHTIVADQTDGTALDEGASATGQIVTFFTEDDAGNVSSVNQQDIVASQLSAYMDILLFDKSYQLVAADFGGLATDDYISRGQAGDSNPLTFDPAGGTVPTLLNLTIDITSGDASASIVFNDATPSNVDAGLGQGEVGLTINITNLDADTPLVPGALVTSTTGAIADGTWDIAFGGIDGAGNPLLGLTIEDVLGDKTPPALPNFSPKAVTGDPETSPAEIIVRGTNSETLSAASVSLDCDVVATGATNDDPISWSLVAGETDSKGPVDNDDFTIPDTDADCTWDWTGTDLAGNVGTETSGLLAGYNPLGATPTPDVIVVASGTASATGGTDVDVQVQIQDAGALAVFGIGASANATDVVTITANFTSDDGACSLGTDCTLVYSGTGVTDGGDNSTATMTVQDFDSAASLNFTVTNESAGVAIFEAIYGPDTGVTGESGNIASTVDAQTDILLSLVTPAANVTAGANYWVSVELVDQFTNRITDDEDFVEISTNITSANVPSSPIKIVGSGTFQTSTDQVGPQTLWARAIGSGTEGSLTVTLLDVMALDSVIGDDVPNDQGNFIYLTIGGIAPEASLVRIFRDVTDVGSVSYAAFTPAPGSATQTVIVYTPDSDATSYAATQETENNSSAGADAVAAKQAFASLEGLNSPYELMAETMMRSKQVTTSTSSDAPIFATLTPDALSMINGIAPSFKTGGDVGVSQMVRTEPIRAIDNIAPAAVQQLRAVDTPSDAGGSISVTWQKSIDDRMLTQNTAQALGANSTSLVQGVAGYNIYRKVADGDLEVVGTASAGESTFTDNSVFNALRYTYAVSPFDTDNVAPAELERTSMAIRNNVKDVSGNFVMGLFGADNSVGFDDFFIFADFFGLTAADAAFDPAFDLNPNNRIDLDDFFVFADYFGRGVNSASRVVPMLAGLNSEASLTLDAGAGLPGIGEEMTIAVDLEDFVELRGYGLSLSYDPAVLEFVGSKVADNLLGEGSLAQPQVISGQDGKASIIAFGETAVDGDLGLNLVFRAKIETEGSYIEITDGQLRDGTYGVNDLRGPVSVMIETRPEVYALNDNYPNPFNPETTIKYQLPEAGLVTLEVYNMLGQVVRTLVNEHQTAGRYSVQWDAANDNGQSLSSGMYFYHVTAGQEFQGTKKMLLLK
jgi:hypothetical protein